MAVAVMITESRDPYPYLWWGAHAARARQSELLILWMQRRSGSVERTEIEPGDESITDSMADACRAIGELGFAWGSPQSESASDISGSSVLAGVAAGELAGNQPDTDLPLRVVRLPESGEAVVGEIGRSTVELLIVPRDPSQKATAQEFAEEREILDNATCHVMQLRTSGVPAERSPRILVPASDGSQTDIALQLAWDLATATGGELTAMYVEPEVDEVAELVGQSILDRVLRRSLAERSSDVTRRIVLDDDVARGIQTVTEQGYDLVLLGVRHHGTVHRLFFRGISERLLTSNVSAALAVVQMPLHWTSRFVRAIDSLLQSGVPQLERQQRVALVERIQASSGWDFDFVALICLSTIIAAAGLIQNSAAVVIGAMLLAPLMTPLMAVGLSLVQGNSVLLKNASRSVLRGFLVAFALGLILGWLVPGKEITNEIKARGSPRLIDLVVAFTGGVAAAYAIGRPNLLSALPGVAIAAALVPPIAASALAMSAGNMQLAGGAALLFLTNIVAIVLGTACSFWAVGVRGTHRHGQLQRWALGVTTSLFLAACALGWYESTLWRSVPPAMIEEINDDLKRWNARYDSAQWIRDDGQRMLAIHLQASSPLPEELPRRVAAIAAKHLNTDVPVQLHTDLVQVTAPP